MHKRSWHPFYTSEGSYYLILYIQSSVRLFAISCVCNSSYSFHRNYIYLKFATMVPSRFGTRSSLHPVSLTLFGRFDPYFGQFDPQFFFLQQMVVSTLFSFLVPNIEQKKLCFCSHSRTVCCKYFNIIIFFCSI